MMPIDLQHEWSAYWTALGLDNALRDAYYDVIAMHMTEAHRAYHNLAHVEALLRDYRGVARFVQNRASFEWKIWFHDLVYQPGALDNELRSAEIGRTMAREAGMSEAFGADVYDGIMATKTHAGMTEDDRLLVTLDLAILAAPEDQFDHYERQIAAEFLSNPAISREAYCAGRLAWAQAFNMRRPIYPTEYGQNAFEAPAHANLDRSIARLEQGDVIVLPPP